MDARGRTTLLWVVGIVAALAAAWLYGRVDPSSPFYPKCPFHTLTGLLCPGCGSQRCLHALLGGDWAAAWHFNPLLMTLGPLALVIALCRLVAFPARGGASPLSAAARRAYFTLTSAAACWTVFAVMVLWWVLRNVFPSLQI